jgi:uncharacterized membrane protein YeaQ/YmgE (transglycosylase-associated protein family)
MTLELFAMWVVVALMAGWLAAIVMRGGGYGRIGDLVLVLIGSVVGSLIFRGLEISPDAGMFELVVVGFVGAVIAIAVQRKFWHARA